MNLDELFEELDVVYQGKVQKVKVALEAAIMNSVKSAQNGNKAASVQVVFKIANKSGRVAIATELINKEPKPEAIAEIFYLDRKGNLSVEDPNQRTFEDMPENVTPINGKGA